MNPTLTVITSDGSETKFHSNAKVNFLHEHLLITIQTDTGIMGIHWDRFAGLIQVLEKAANSPESGRCEALLKLDGGNEKKIKISQFRKSDLVPGKNLINLTGATERAVINLDFFQSYRLHN